MKFRTEIQLSPRKPQIQYSDRWVCMGSCFAERIGGRLQEAKFSALVNPLGIVYNPVSLCKQLMAIMGEKTLDAPHYHEQLAYWHSFDVHSSLNHADKQVYTRQIAEAISQAQEQLKSARYLILTFGTAWVYKRKDTAAIVANCHKYPQDFFTRDLLTSNAMMEAMFALVRTLRVFNPKLEMILTVSPVRHIKDGLERNAVSKAALRLLCQQLKHSFEHIHYFPAYEIMLDDLRDYRYYQSDLIHPTFFAEDYIWQQFVKTHFTKETQEVLLQWEQLQKEIRHQPLRPNSEQYRAFLQKLLAKLQDISEKLPCEEEIGWVRERLQSLH